MWSNLTLSKNNWTGGSEFKFQFPRRNRLCCLEAQRPFSQPIVSGKWLIKVFSVWIDLLACAHSVHHISSLLHLLQAFIVVVVFSSATMQYFFPAPQHKIISKIQSCICSVSIRLTVSYCSPTITPAAPAVWQVLPSLCCAVGKYFLHKTSSGAIKTLPNYLWWLVSHLGKHIGLCKNLVTAHFFKDLREDLRASASLDDLSTVCWSHIRNGPSGRVTVKYP